MRTTNFSFGLTLGAMALVLGCGVEEVPEGAYGSIENAVCASLSVSRDVASPSDPGTDITFTASAGCDGGDTPEYQFGLKGPGDTGYTLMQAYGGGASWVWNQTGGEAPGLYYILVYARNTGSGVSQESWRVLTHQIAAGDVCTTSPAVSAERTGALMKLTGSVTCSGTATPEYLFYARGPQDTGFSQIRNWGTSASYDFDVSGADQGLWTFIMYARNVGSTATYESSSYTLAYNTVCDATSLDYSSLGSNMWRITGQADCGSNGRYAFFLRGPEDIAYTEIRGWSHINEFDWNATGYADGAYTLLMYVRGRDATIPDDWQARVFTLGPQGVCNQTDSVAFTPSASEDIGTLITVTASVTCTLGATPETTYYIKRPGQSGYTLLRDWGATAYAWDTTGEAEGTYTILVYSRAQGTVETWRARNVTLNTPPVPQKLVIWGIDGAFDGNLGGRSGADLLCASPPVSLTNIHAFISVPVITPEQTDEIRDMADNYGYPTDVVIETATGTKLADNWADLLDGSIAATLAAGGYPYDFWSGSDDSGAIVPDTCSGWTSNAPGENGGRGDQGATSNWLSRAGTPTLSCDSTRGIFCLGLTAIDD